MSAAMMPEVGRPKNNDYPTYMTPDGDRGGFIVRNPVTGKKRRFSARQEALARQTAELLIQWVVSRKQDDALSADRPKVSYLISRWRDERLALMPWDTSTRQTAQWRLRRIDSDMGDRLIEETDCVYLDQWLSSKAAKADPFNKWRGMLVLLWRFAVAQKMVQSNEAEKVEPRSTSRKIAGNRKIRRQLGVDGFQAIHANAPAWLQLAMEVALITLQSRKEICGMRHSDFRDGYLFVIRDKVAADSCMAFIKIPLTAALESLRSRAQQLKYPHGPNRELGSIASPYLVHRPPERRQRRWMKNKPHWTYVNERYLTQAFAEARDKVERFQAMPERHRPTFHEIRGLGARLYQAKGIAKADIQSLMTHSNPSTTTIYLELGPQALTQDHFKTVSAPFTVRDLVGSLGEQR